MKVSFCPHCQQKVSVPESLKNQSVRCPFCQRDFTATFDSADAQGISHMNSVSKLKKRKSNGVLRGAMMMLAMFLLGGGLYIAVQKFQSKDSTALSHSPNALKADSNTLPNRKDIKSAHDDIVKSVEINKFTVIPDSAPEIEKSLLEEITAQIKSVNGMTAESKFKSLTTDPLFTEKLLRWNIFHTVGAPVIERIGLEPEGQNFLNLFFNNRVWMETFMTSGPMIEPTRSMSLLYLIWKYDTEKSCEKPGVFQNLAVSCALSAHGSDYIAVETYRQYLKYHHLGQLHARFNTLTARELRYTVIPGKVSEEDMAYLIENHNVTAGDYGGVCWSCPYRLHNSFDDSIHGPLYSRPWQHVYSGHQSARIVGAVCGGLSTYGSAAANAHGIPSITGGQPGHCAYTVRHLDNAWNIHYYVNYPTGLHAVFPDQHSYRYLPLMEDIFADTAAYLRSEQYVWLASALIASARPSTVRVVPEECLTYDGKQKKGTNYSTLTPTKKMRAETIKATQFRKKNNFTALWTGRLESEQTETIPVTLASAGDVRLTVGKQVIQYEKSRQNGRPMTVNLNLTAGKNPFTLEMVHGRGTPVMTFSTNTPDTVFNRDVNIVYQLAVKELPVNFHTWEIYGKWLQNKTESTGMWQDWARKAVIGLGKHHEHSWRLVMDYAVKGVQDAHGTNGVMNFLSEIHQMTQQPEQGVGEHPPFDNIIRQQTGLFGKDKSAQIKLVGNALKAHAGSSHYFPKILSFAGDAFLPDQKYAPEFLSVLENALPQNEKNASGPLNNFFRQATTQASQQGNIDIFQQVMKLKQAVEKKPPPEKLCNRSSFPVLSDKGLLQLSSMARNDRSETYRDILDLSDAGGICQTNNEKNPHATVILPGDAEIKTIYIRNISGRENENQLPLVVSVSDDKIKWKEVFRTDKPEPEWLIDLSTKNVRGRYIKAERPEGTKETQFKLVKFQIYGKKLY